MAEKKKKKDDKKKIGRLQKQARRDVNLAIDPILDEIRRAGQQAERQYEQNSGRLGDIYTGLRQELAPLGGQYDASAQQIQADLNTQLGGLAGLLGPTQASYEGLAPADAAAAEAAYRQQVGGEGAAATQMFGGIGAGAQSLLANDRSRNLGYQTSTQRQAGLDKSAYEKSFLQDYRNLLEDLRTTRLDTMQDVPTQFLARLDQLRQQRTQNRLAQSELELRESIANKELNQKDQAFNYAKKKDQNQTEFARSEVERRRDRKAIKPIRGDIRGLRDRRGDLADRIESLTGTVGGPEVGGYSDPPKVAELKARRKRINQKIKRKKKRIRTIKAT